MGVIFRFIILECKKMFLEKRGEDLMVSSWGIFGQVYFYIFLEGQRYFQFLNLFVIEMCFLFRRFELFRNMRNLWEIIF